MLSLREVHRGYGERVILDGVSWRLLPGERVALVGPNGAGKSTFMRLLAGVDQPDGGRVEFPASWRVGWLPQEPPDLGNRTLSEVLWDGLPEIRVAAAALEAVAGRLQVARGPQLEACVLEQERLQSEFERLEGHLADARVGRVAHGLGFAPGDLTRPMDSFSGGWRVKAALGRLLISAPEVLLLDEPTNHLDVAAISWLERYLCERPWGLVVVSHDRTFLDAVATRVTALERGEVRDWMGNYSRHLVLREAEDAALEAAANRQDREHARVRRFIERFRASARRSSQARSRERALEREERIIRPRADVPRLKLDLGDAAGTPREVVRLEQVRHAYGDREVIPSLDLVLERGTRLALVGANGTGKTTLLRLLAGEVEPSSGTVSWARGVERGYLAQHAPLPARPSRTVFEHLWELAPDGWTIQDVRDLLAEFLFRGSAADRATGVLSGGERARLALAAMLLAPKQVLLLDEPTNHLDLGAREVLAEALSDFEGVVVFSSHDRWLLQHVATHALVWPGPVLRPLDEADAWAGVFGHMDTATLVPLEPSAQATARASVGRESQGRTRFNAYRNARAVAEVEGQLAALQIEREACLQRIGIPGPDAAEAARLMARLEEEQGTLEERWLVLAEEAEAAGQGPM
ncbi:MAG: ABC-F family ATP-binding cassette domain-containing protein [Candidatus Sericytochromatia bacterium]|nr:ABC-F family ATP-binding cassette domain-containing protein [Candidatus Sericytochromatia bacterium]